MKTEPLTRYQLDCIEAAAREKGISSTRFQQALKDGSVERFLDGLAVDPNPVFPPPEARIHTITVRVNESVPWEEAAKSVMPRGKYDDVLDAGNNFPSSSDTAEDERIVLINYEHHLPSNLIIARKWADRIGLRSITPRALFAIGKSYPTLNVHLDLGIMYVVASTECVLGDVSHVFSIGWFNETHGLWRSLDLGETQGTGGGCAWFAFRR